MCNIKQKICPRCNIKKPLTNQFFHKKLDKFNSHCKECRKEKSKQFYAKNKKSINDKTQKYYEKHKDELIKYAKEYRIKNQEKLKIYEKNRYISKSNKYKLLGQKDGSRKIVHNIRVCINRCIKDKQKQSNSLSYLGCSLEEFKKHLEYKFDENMSWSNYGRPNNKNSDGWHIDHIKPLSSFNFSEVSSKKELEEKLKQAWHYTNLQPLWGLDNIRKGAK